MKYCPDCGTALITKIDGIDGETPYCPKCEKFVYPTFSSAISTVMLNPDKNKILLIEQYASKANILVAGYVMKGEDDIQTLTREVNEEVGLQVKAFAYNDDAYFAKTNTLLHNYISVLNDENFTLTNEVDFARWYSFDEALQVIKPHSLAQNFLSKAITKLRAHEVFFEEDLNKRIW